MISLLDGSLSIRKRGGVNNDTLPNFYYEIGFYSKITGQRYAKFYSFQLIV